MTRSFFGRTQFRAGGRGRGAPADRPVGLRDLGREGLVPLVMLTAFFVALCIAGGASREDVLAQPVIRAVAVALMAGQIAFGYFGWKNYYRPCALFLGGMAAIALIQLVPLPPELWTRLPGREIIANSPMGTQSWRPLNMVPDAGLNTLFSLLIPLCVLMLVSALPSAALRFTPHLIVGAVTVSAVFALAQAGGVAPDNLLINGSTDSYAGIFANRNHQALFLAIGIVMACHLGVERGVDPRSGRLWLAASLILLFAISILVTGSRTGALLAVIALLSGALMAWRRGAYGGKAALVSVVVLAVGCGLAYLLASYFGRAASIDRATNLNPVDDFRLRSLSVVLKMAGAYFPFGSGLGSFNAAFRIVEPNALLEPTYFNHAHDDFLEILIETGVVGVALLTAAAIWLIVRTVRAFTASGEASALARVGGVVAILIGIASVSDYPGRTPMIMAVLVMIGCWLAARPTDAAHHALRSRSAAL